MKYVRDLHNADDRVESVSPQIGKASRVFVGVVITHNNRKYCIPLSHPKEKHKKMANNAELQKIEVEEKIIGVDIWGTCKMIDFNAERRSRTLLV